MLRLPIDRYSEVHPKMRRFEKANHKYDEDDGMDKKM